MTRFRLYWAFSVFAEVLICLGDILAFGLAMALKVLLSNAERSPIVQIFFSGCTSEFSVQLVRST